MSSLLPSLLLLTLVALSATHAQSTVKVGTLSSTSPGYKGCQATLLGDRAILTTRDCLYDAQAKKSRLPLHFTIGGAKVQVNKVFPPTTFAGNEYDYALGLLASPVTASKAVFAWTYKALEDAGVKVQTTTSQYSCRSSEDPKAVRMRRVSTEVIRMSCSGLSSSTLPGAPVVVVDTATSLPNIVGVYQGRCSSGGGVCATRMHGKIYQHVCRVAAEKGVTNIPGCDDPILNVTDVHEPTLMSTAEGYNQLMALGKSRGVLLQFCARSLCTKTSCEVCRYCAEQGQRVFNDLDMLKSLNFRVVVRTVDISDLDLVEVIAEVPYIVYRKQGETDFYVYQYPMSEVVEMFAQRTKRAKSTASRRRATIPRSCKKKVTKLLQPLKKPKCTRRRATVVAGVPRNVWTHYCNANLNTYYTMSTKQRFLGQNQERHTTVLSATIVCQQGGGARHQIAQVICQSGGGNHAERNLRQYLRTQVTGGVLGALQAAAAGKACELGIVINNFPCYDRCSGAGAIQQNLPDVYAWMTANMPTVGARRIAYANFYPALRFNYADCSLEDQDAAVTQMTDAMRTLVATGYVPYLCTFDDAWFNAYWAAYTLQLTQDRWNALKTARQDQTRCETAYLRARMENNVPGFVWRTKTNCVSAIAREQADEMPPLIPVANW